MFGLLLCNWNAKFRFICLSFRNLFLTLLEQPVTYGGNLVAVVKRGHVLHGTARLREYAACLPLDEVDVAATGYQLLGSHLMKLMLPPRAISSSASRSCSSPGSLALHEAESTRPSFAFSTFARSCMPPYAFWSPPATM